MATDSVPGLSITDQLKDLRKEIENALPTMNERLSRYSDAFDAEFPLRGGRYEGEERGMAEAFTWAFMGGPLSLYALNLNGPSIVDLYGILERFATRDAAKHLSGSEASSQILSRTFDRLSLPAKADLISELGFWDRNDVKFVAYLTSLRNGTAHKNPRLISNTLLSGARISFLDIDSTLAKVDVIPLILGTLRLMNKLTRAGRKQLRS